MARPIVQTLMFLTLLVCGHLTIYLTRNTKAFWRRPFPCWQLVVACETTQVIATLVAVYGFGIMTSPGWKYTIAVWIYALVWFFMTDMAKLAVYRMLHLGTASHQRHLARINANLHQAAQGKAATTTA